MPLEIVVLGGTFLVCLLVQMPIAFSLLLPSITVLAMRGTPLVLVAQRIYAGLDSFSLLAIPFFMLAGELMNAGGVTRRLVRFCDALVGRFTGGFSLATVVSNMIMAGISGSAVADATAIGTVMIPSMKDTGYDVDFSVGITAAASVCGPIIPPSIPLVVYGALAQISVGDLFLGGAVPGILLGLGLMLIAYVLSVRRRYARSTTASLREILKSGYEGFWALLMPVIVLGGILGGVFTATEAAAVAAVYALVASMFIYREVKLRDLPRILRSATIQCASVLFIIAAAGLFAWVFVTAQIPQRFASWVFSFTSSRALIIAMILLLLLVVGCFMETVASLIILGPILAPLVSQIGMDPIHFGVVLVFGLCLGLLTPPVGVSLSICANIGRIPLDEATRGVLPFLALSIGVLFLIAYVPGLVTFLPRLFG